MLAISSPGFGYKNSASLWVLLYFNTMQLRMHPKLFFVINLICKNYGVCQTNCAFLFHCTRGVQIRFLSASYNQDHYLCVFCTACIGRSRRLPRWFCLLFLFNIEDGLNIVWSDISRWNTWKYLRQLSTDWFTKHLTKFKCHSIQFKNLVQSKHHYPITYSMHSQRKIAILRSHVAAWALKSRFHDW